MHHATKQPQNLYIFKAATKPCKTQLNCIISYETMTSDIYLIWSWICQALVTKKQSVYLHFDTIIILISHRALAFHACKCELSYSTRSVTGKFVWNEVFKALEKPAS